MMRDYIMTDPEHRYRPPEWIREQKDEVLAENDWEVERCSCQESGIGILSQRKSYEMMLARWKRDYDGF